MEKFVAHAIVARLEIRFRATAIWECLYTHSNGAMFSDMHYEHKNMLLGADTAAVISNAETVRPL